MDPILVNAQRKSVRLLWGKSRTRGNEASLSRGHKHLAGVLTEPRERLLLYVIKNEIVSNQRPPLLVSSLFLRARHRAQAGEEQREGDTESETGSRL